MHVPSCIAGGEGEASAGGPGGKGLAVAGDSSRSTSRLEGGAEDWEIEGQAWVT